MLNRRCQRFLFSLIVLSSLPVFVYAQGVTPPKGCAPSISGGGQCCTIDGRKTDRAAVDALLKSGIRTEIRIPNLGQDVICTKYNSSGAPFSQEHFSIVKDLADYISGFYKFFVGIIGVLAVVMILYGAIQWIAAAGNPGKIGAAKEQISSALIGLVLALTSYAILNLINPALVSLKVPSVEDVTPKQQRILFSSIWCKDFPGTSVTPVVSGKQGCGDEGRTSDGQTCVFGREYGGCQTYEVCLPPNGVVKGFACYSPTNPDEIEAYCENVDKTLCSKVDGEIVSATRNVENLGKACRLSIQNAISIDALNEDECTWGQLLDCSDLGANWEQVGCSTGGTECWDGNKAKDCASDIPTDRDSFCTDDTRAAKGADAICCKLRNTNLFHCHI